jgi:hypothetical protein
MEEIKPKKERKFLKAMGEVALTLVRDLLLNVGKKVINKSGNKRQGLVLAFIILASTFAIAQFPSTGNKQRLGFQTTADGLVWRGSLSDTASIQPINNQSAWVILDTVNLKMYSFDFTSNVWNLVGISGGGGLTMPFDSITFNTAKNGTVGVGEVEYNDTQGSLIQGLKGGNVTNVIGQQLHQRVNNRTGAPLAKGDVVYLAGSQGNRITVAKGLAVTDAFSANTFGVVAESIADNASGFIITEGLITGLNTSALTEDSAVYLSPTVPGALTSTKPQAPQHSVYIGVCVKSNNGSGELFIKIRNGQELDELHDTQITNPVTGATLYYSGGLWRDTTAALLVSDTASMLTNYLRTGTAASTYLPLTGGTLSGSSSNNNYTDTLLNVDYQFTGLPNNQSVTGIRSNVNTNGVNSFGIISDASTIYNTAIGVRGKATHLDVGGTGSAYAIVGEIAASGSGSSGTTYAGYFNNTSTVGGNHYGLFVNTASGGDYGIYQTGSGTNYFGSNTSIGGTLGVTGATTLSNLAGTGSRMVIASSAGLLSTQAIPTGTVTSVGGTGAISSSGGTTPVISVATAAFGTAGIVSSTGTQQFSGDKVFEGYTQFNGIAFFKNYTYQATRLAGLSSTDRFATVTLGSGLSLSGGVLSATSGGVTSVTASTPLSSSGGANPNITITDASTGASGVVNTTTQSFAGNKTFTGTLDVSSTGTFGGRVKTNWLERNYAYSTSSSFTISVNTTWQDINTSVLTTVTLPNAATYPGKELHIRQSGAGQIISFSSNVIPFTSPPTSSPVTSILNPTTNKAVTLVSDGTNWIIMQRSEN